MKFHPVETLEQALAVSIPQPVAETANKA
jgi:hypothetical protein